MCRYRLRRLSWPAIRHRGMQAPSVACGMPMVVRRREFQLHITNMGPHKPCCCGKVIRFLLGILKRRWFLRVDFLVIHHDASDMYNANIRQCQQQTTYLGAALGGTVLWQPKRQESPAVPTARSIALMPPPTALLYQLVDHNRNQVLEMLDAAVLYQEQEPERK